MNVEGHPVAGEEIDLAHEPDFLLGGLSVAPSLRSVSQAGKEPIQLEPRVMQVLIALCRAGGRILSRDDLIATCWKGQIVSDGSINRVISRLRHVAEEFGGADFSVETVPRVGYRLLGECSLPSAAPTSPPPPRGWSRRLVMLAGASGVAAASLVAWQQLGGHAADPAVEAEIDQGIIAMQRDDAQGYAKAVSHFRRAVELDDQYADGWGLLALAYGQTLYWVPVEEREVVEERLRSAAGRALALEADNASALAAQTGLLPVYGNWLETERSLRALLARRPNLPQAQLRLASTMWQVGRQNEGMKLLEPVAAILAREHLYASGLAEMGRIDEAEMLSDRLTQESPRSVGIWFSRFWIYVRSGQAGRGLAMIDDEASLPVGVPPWNYDMMRLTAEAYRDRSADLVSRAVEAHQAAAFRGRGFCENAIQVLSDLGRIDEAFSLAEAYFFQPDRFRAGLRFTQEQGVYDLSPNTGFLFQRSNANLRRDRRFGSLVKRIGLVDYWRKSGTRPESWSEFADSI